jgi:signal transduction histidine kinase
MPDERLNGAEGVLTRFVLEYLPEPILLLDGRGLPVQLNQAARLFHQIPLMELFLPEKVEEPTRRFLEELRARGRAALVIPGGASRTNGNHCVLEGFAVGKSFVVRARDASYERALHDLKKEVSHLRQAESLGLMAATVIHDLNNLLTPLLCFSATLAAELDENSPAAALVADVESLAARAAALTQDALAFARPKARGIETLNLSETVSEMRPIIERLFGGSAELVFALDANLGETRVERGRFEHALLNLLANARNAMPHGGRLTITTANMMLGSDQQKSTRPSRYVALAVTDTGVGMTEEVGAQAFDDFFTTRDGSGGTGLGLASVKRFVTESAGFVRLESELGRGTTVSLCLPRIDG